MAAVAELPLQIEVDLIAKVVSMETVRELVGRNTDMRQEDDQLAIRSGILLANDSYPGVLVNVQSIEHNKDLSHHGNLQTATVEVTVLSYVKPECWALRNAIAYDGGDPMSLTRSTGLDRYKDHSKQIFGCAMTSDEIDVREISVDGTDRVLWFLDTTYTVEFRERKA